MSKYRTEFQLDKNDVEMIESAIRTVIQNGINFGAECESNCESFAKQQVQQWNSLLAKIHHQKVFYSQVKEPGVPAA